MLGERGGLSDTCLGSAELGNLLGRGLVSEWHGQPSELSEGADPPVSAGLRMLSGAKSVASGSRGSGLVEEQHRARVLPAVPRAPRCPVLMLLLA